MTKRIKRGDVVRFQENQSRWVIHMTLENGGGAARAIPTKSLIKLEEATSETIEFVNFPVQCL